MSYETTSGTIEEQLEAIYAEREWLSNELGVADAEDVVNMVRNLEMQLCDLYRIHGPIAPMSNQATMQLLTYVQELSQHLDQMYSEKSVEFHIEDDKPVIKASWKEILSEGDAQ